jgi:hypothetical protein
MNLQYIVEVILGSPLLIFLTAVSLIMILLMITTLLKQQPINNVKITKNESSETEPEPIYDITIVTEEPSAMKIPFSQKEDGSNVKNMIDLDIRHLVKEQKDLCTHCSEFKDLSFAVCPNCGNALNIPSDT